VAKRSRGEASLDVSIRGVGSLELSPGFAAPCEEKRQDARRWWRRLPFVSTRERSRISTPSSGAFEVGGGRPGPIVIVADGKPS